MTSNFLKGYTIAYKVLCDVASSIPTTTQLTSLISSSFSYSPPIASLVFFKLCELLPQGFALALLSILNTLHPESSWLPPFTVCPNITFSVTILCRITTHLQYSYPALLFSIALYHLSTYYTNYLLCSLFNCLPSRECQPHEGRDLCFVHMCLQQCLIHEKHQKIILEWKNQTNQSFWKWVYKLIVWNSECPLFPHISNIIGECYMIRSTLETYWTYNLTKKNYLLLRAPFTNSL